MGQTLAVLILALANLFMLLLLTRLLFWSPVQNLSAANFDVYLINMDKNRNRLEHFKKMYAKTDLASKPFIRFEAINGKALGDGVYNSVSPRIRLGLDHYEQTGERVGYAQMTPGMIGCYLSHYAIYEKIWDSRVDFGIIFEDDANISKNIYSKVIRHVAEDDGKFPRDWDVILLGHICRQCEDATPYYKTPKYFWGLHGYMVSRKGAKALLDNQEPAISMQIDHYIGALGRAGLLNIYALHPAWVGTVNFGSDLQTVVTPNAPSDQLW